MSFIELAIISNIYLQGVYESITFGQIEEAVSIYVKRPDTARTMSLAGLFFQVQGPKRVSKEGKHGYDEL